MASKKSRRRSPAKENPTDLTEETLLTALTDLHDNTEVAEREVNEVPPQPKQLSLADIRNEALKAHKSTSQIIADLEAWRSEIEATIAFLKARGR